MAMGTREFTRVPNRTCLPSSALIQPKMIVDPGREATHQRQQSGRPSNRRKPPEYCNCRADDGCMHGAGADHADPNPFSRKIERPATCVVIKYKWERCRLSFGAE